jgi:outer membrane receptor protein involved in Fe transport
LLQYQNKDQDPSKGIELELTQEWNQHWLMRATYTNIYENNDLSYREADQLFSLMVNYEQGKWNANLIATYHNEREMATGGSDSYRIKLDSDWQLFGKLRYLFKSDLQGFIQVKNLLDEEHLTPASNAILTEGVSNRGREILIGMTWQF